MKFDITLNINGRDYPIRVEPRRTLVDAIRDDCGQTGTHIGCEHGICGACTIILDDDIDPADMNQVVWAMCTRFDPREDIEVLRGCWSTTLDPMAYSHDDPRNARVVIDACKPWARRDTFPIEARSSKELDARIRAKFAAFLPKGR